MRTVKVGVVGKGGVGKTTVSALLASGWAAAGRRVVAIDTDSNPNLGLSLGLGAAAAEAVPVLPRSAVVGGFGGPPAAELIRQYGRATPAGVLLLSAMRVDQAGAGCTCGGHATVRSLLADALAGTADVVVVDMEAGLEHLSRAGGTLAHVDVLLVVVDPNRKAVLTAARTAALAEELGIGLVLAIGNKAATDDERHFLAEALRAAGLRLAGMLPYDPAVAAADRAGRPTPPASALTDPGELGRVMAAVLAAADQVPAAN